MVKPGRPIANNIDYFPHKCKDDKELMFIQHKYKSEGYEVFYRLQQSLGDAEFHRINLNNELEKEMFEMGMKVHKEVVYGVIDILAGMNWLDKEVYEKENILWSDKFVDSIRAVYINRKRAVPNKQDIYNISTCRNRSIVENSIEKESKEERVKDDSLLSFDEYEKLYPDVDVNKSLKKFLEFNTNPIHKKAMDWLAREKNKKPITFDKTLRGLFKAWCSKCGKKSFPNNEYQLKQESECCRVEYSNKKPDSLKKNKV